MRVVENGSRRDAPWRKWGPYLSERQWGTVREDYSATGEAWTYFPHDHARSRAYRWGEDGIAGISDMHQHLCFALALWNGEDPIVKERLFGLTGPEGNHGEDVKEYYYYLDNVPSHAYMKMLYKYPHREYPYAWLVQENARRSKTECEFELIDTGIFDDDAYFDVFVEYAKNDPEDVLVRITAINRGKETHPLHLLPTLWFRNDWSWRPRAPKPEIKLEHRYDWGSVATATHWKMGGYRLYTYGEDELLFCENETNSERLYRTPNSNPWCKDGINDYMVHGAQNAVNRADFGTKMAARYSFTLGAGESKSVYLRLSQKPLSFDCAPDGRSAQDDTFNKRKAEADEFYQNVNPYPVSEDLREIQRQAFAGLLWTKQSYHFVVSEWLKGDPLQPEPPAGRKRGRNRDWPHLYAVDVISMPDKWEYPWFAAWDLAFHVVALAMIDPEFAKHQLVLLTREWYMHPNGQLPAYEWNFGDVNPPVHAWAAIRVYQIEKKMYGTGDLVFLERVFQKLLINFTWWVNRKDADGNNVFQGGFLGLDNIGIFDRSAQLPTGGHMNQSDGTSWMCVYTLNLAAIALELAQHNHVYEDIASKFFEHFLYIAHALNNLIGDEEGLWDGEDGFYYDVLKLDGGRTIPIKIHSLVGLLPLLAVAVGEKGMALRLPEFRERMAWFIENSKDLTSNVAALDQPGYEQRLMLAVLDRERIEKICARMLDESRFLSDYGIRSISKHHKDEPYVLDVDGQHWSVGYEPAESMSGTFGGNSNWRGPIWFPINYLLVEALQKFHYHCGDDFRVECPVGSGRMLTLWEVSMELSHRMMRIFERGPDGRRAVFGQVEKFQTDPHWRDYIPFYEYFHGDDGRGLGASHQTGWTGLIAKMVQQHGEYCERGVHPFDRGRKKVTTAQIGANA